MTPASVATGARRGARLARPLLAGAAVLASLIVPETTTPAPSAAAGNVDIRVVGQVPLLFPDALHNNGVNRAQTGWLLLNPASRRGYQVFWVETAETGEEPFVGTVIQSFDLDSLQPIARRRFPGVVPLFQDGSYGGLVHAVDEKGLRLFLPVGGERCGVRCGTSADGKQQLRHIEVIDEERFESGAERFSTQLSFPTPQQQAWLGTLSLNGLLYDGPPGRGRLLLLWSGGHTNHHLSQWGVDRPTEDSWHEPSLLSAACGRADLHGAEHGRTAWEWDVLRTRAYIALACQKSEGVAQVVRIELDANERPIADTIAIRPLPRRVSDVVADQQGERLFLRSANAGNAWWVYDGRRDAWVGTIGVAVADNGLENSVGLDPTTGRLYALIPNYYATGPHGHVPVVGGFGFSDARLTPPPQLRMTLPELAKPSKFYIEVDPVTEGLPRRLFVRRGVHNSSCFEANTVTATTCDPDDYYTVLEDHEPVIAQAAGDNPDRFTTEVAEARGITDVNFDRAGAGFGARVLLIGGASALASREFDGPPSPFLHGSNCLPGDREVVAGEVQLARASNVTASAQSNSLRVDANTALDMQDPARRCWATPVFGNPNLLPSLPRPPDEPRASAEPGTASASCTGNRHDEPEPPPAPPTHEAKASCTQETGMFDSAAGLHVHEASALAVGTVAVASATSRAWTERDPDKGVVTRVESVARGVQLGSLGTIGLVRARTATWAGGRPGTAGSEFTREICQVSLDIVKHSGCLDEAQLKTLATALNTRLSGNGEVVFRRPDTDYAKGSAGGFQAAVQRDRVQHFTDTVLTRDPSKVVPALELIIYRDDAKYGSGRQVFQFAGVEASSQYGIYCLFGAAPSGKACNTSALGPVDGDGEPTSGAEAFSSGYLGDAADGGSSGSFESAAPTASTGTSDEGSGNPVARLLRRLAQVPADVLRLIASGPAELLLTAGMWLLVWLPCCLFERRRAARRALPLRF